MPSNSPPGASVRPPSTSLKLRFALPANAFPLRKWNTSPPTSSTRLLLGVALSILSLRPTLSRFCRPLSACGPSKILRDSFVPVVFFSSLPAPASPPTPKAKCPGLSLVRNSRPLKLPVSNTFLSKILENQPFAVSARSTVSHFEYFSSYAIHILFGGNPTSRIAFFSNCSAGSEENDILWQPVEYSSNFKEKETAMFQKL